MKALVVEELFEVPRFFVEELQPAVIVKFEEELGLQLVQF